jgi:hypothetical protein
MRRHTECLFEHAAELTVAQVHVPRELGDSEPLLQIFGDEARDAPGLPRGQALISEKRWLINDDSELVPFARMLEHLSSPLPQVLDVGSVQASCCQTISPGAELDFICNGYDIVSSAMPRMWYGRDTGDDSIHERRTSGCRNRSRASLRCTDTSVAVMAVIFEMLSRGRRMP